MTRRGAQGGFTLLEVMVAVSILALMMVIGYGTVRRTMQAKRDFESVQERFRQVRIALDRIVTDLQMAYISSNEDRNLLEPRTFFVGESSGDLGELRFTCFGHTPLYADANESDQTAVVYFTESDPDVRGQTNLYRREYRRLTSEGYDNEPSEVNVVFPGVTKFKVEFFDAQQRSWKDSWDTQKADGLPRVPDRVRVTLAFEDERGEEVAFVTQARLPIQEMVQGFAN